MTSLLTRLFIRNRDAVQDPAVRRAYGVMTGAVGIVANILLAALKLLAGALSGSISITADAVNNLSDAGSQLISLISFRISAKPADRDHPFGHARIEYVASMIVSFLVLLVGVELLRGSVRKIRAPEPIDFRPAVLIILLVSVAVKLWLFFFNRKIGKKIDSTVIRATGTDSLSDAAATSAVLISALISHFTGFDTDAYMGILVAVIILIAGVKILNETKNSILGGAPDPKVVADILALAREYPAVLGVHDLMVHSYGAGNTIASFHAEVDGAQDIFVTHDAIDMLEKEIYSRLGIRATVHMDPIVTDNEKIDAMRAEVLGCVRSVDERLDIHDFRCVDGVTHTNLIFDVTVPFEVKMSDGDVRKAISSAVSRRNPNYFTVITIDRQ